MHFKISKNMRDAAKISTGTVIGQLCSIISLPFITRIYGSEIIGAWATIYAIAIIICTVSDCGILQSLMVEDEKDVANTYTLTSNLVFLISLGFFPFVFIYSKFILRQTYPEIFITTFFVIAYAITYQQVQIEYTLLNRYGNYNILMKNPVINQASAAIISVLLGILGFKRYGYYIGITAGQVLTLMHMRHSIQYRLKFAGFFEIGRIIRKHKKFVTYQMPVNITLQARDQVPNLLIGTFFGNSALGYYSISQKLLNIPITFIGQALGRVFYQRCAEMKRNGEDIAQFFYRNLQRAFLIAVIPLVLLAAFGDAAIVILFGSEYSIGGVIARIVVFRAFFAFVSASTRSIDIILDKQQYAMVSSLTQTILISLCIVVSHLLSLNIIICTMLMTASFIVIQIGYFCLMFQVMGLPMKYYLKNVLVSLAIVIVAALFMRYGFMYITELTQWKLFVYLKHFMVL